jgi:hypothetical protein
MSEARKLVNQLRTLSKQQYVPPSAFASIATLGRDKASALAHFEQAYAERSSYLMLLKMEPNLDFLRSDPRFRDPQHRVGLLP